MLMTKYSRTKPCLWSKDSVHTCYEGHDCEERWTVGHHLAEALSCIENIGHERIWSVSGIERCQQEVIHHIMRAWEKSK